LLRTNEPQVTSLKLKILRTLKWESSIQHFKITTRHIEKERVDHAQQPWESSDWMCTCEMSLSSSLWSQTSQFQPPVVMWYRQLWNPCSHVVFECKKSYCSQNSLEIVWCLRGQLQWKKVQCGSGLGNSKMAEQTCTKRIAVATHLSWMMNLSPKSAIKFMKISGSQFPSYRSVFHKFHVTYISLWNCGREAALPLSLCKMGAQNADRWTKKAAHQP
jgi:hypothetical protein